MRTLVSTGMYYCLILLPLALLATGCKSDPARDALERELRMQEDAIYDLQAHLADCQRQLDACHTGVGVITKTPATSSGAPATSLPGIDGPPAVSLPGDPSPPTAAPGLHKRPSGGSRDEAPPYNPRSSSPKLDVPMSPDVELPSSPKHSAPQQDDTTQTVPGNDVTQIVLNPQLTGALPTRGQPGSQGVRVVFELRNAQGQVVRAPGDIAVAVLDPSQDGVKARFARWDVPASKSMGHFHDQPAPGVYLDLPWPKQAPENNSLQLFVRYKTPDGRKLVTDLPIDLQTPAGNTAQWTKASTPIGKPAWQPSESPAVPSEELPAPQTEHAPLITPPPSTPAPETAPPPSKPMPAAEPAPLEIPEAPELKPAGPTTRRGRPQWSPLR